MKEGDSVAAERFLLLVYADLRKLASLKLAQETPGQTLQVTALVAALLFSRRRGHAAAWWTMPGASSASNAVASGRE